MMPALNPERDIFVSLSEGQYINVLDLLRIIAEAIRQAQKRLDRRQLCLARWLLKSTPPGFPRRLLDLFTFRRYKISALSIEFTVQQRKTKPTYDAPMRFRLANGQTKRKRIRKSSLKLLVDNQTLAEFRIDGELAASVIISGYNSE